MEGTRLPYKSELDKELKKGTLAKNKKWAAISTQNEWMQIGSEDKKVENFEMINSENIEDENKQIIVMTPKLESRLFGSCIQIESSTNASDY